MRVSRFQFVVASSAAAVFLAACQGGAPGDSQPAAGTAIAEIRAEPPREDPVLAEQRRLAAELASLEKHQASLAQSFAEQNEEAAQSERGIRDMERSLEQQKAETSQYIDQHELQVACAFADGIARGEGNYSEEVKRCAEVASVYCAFANLSGTFRAKVAAARKYVDEGEARAESLKTRIAAKKKELELQRAKIQAAQEEIDRAALEIAAVRQKLTNLGDGLQPILPRGDPAPWESL